jgi:hypothetical protein
MAVWARSVVNKEASLTVTEKLEVETPFLMKGVFVCLNITGAGSSFRSRL